jgi:hypothetical protein
MTTTDVWTNPVLLKPKKRLRKKFGKQKIEKLCFNSIWLSGPLSTQNLEKISEILGQIFEKV